MKKEFKVEGMNCGSCAANLENTLNNSKGILNANVNIATEKASVEYDPDEITDAKLAEIVEIAGYKAIIEDVKKNEKVSLKINGMTCTSCASNIENTLNKTEGIVKAEVNFPAEKINIAYNPNVIRLINIKEIVSGIGFELLVNEELDESEEEDEDQRKVAEAWKKLKVSAILAGIIMALMIVHMFIFTIPGYLVIVAILAFPIIFGTGLPVHKASFKALKNRRPNMDVLVSMGSLPPYIIGLGGLFFPIQTFIEMASAIMTFHLIGKYLEIQAKGRASQAIKKLIQMGAKTANILVDGKEVQVPTKELQVNDIMVIRPGEKIPTDGIVVNGESMIDESMATGESIPVTKSEGDEVIGATINKLGMLKVKVTKVGKDTFLSQVVKMVEECQGTKVPIQEFADKITGYFVPVIMGITVLTFISFNVFSGFHLRIIQWGAEFLPWVNPELPPITLAFITATAVLVIACPCALGLGTPTALMVGSGIGAEKGILIRNGEAVQTFKEVKLIAFDKTGTVTKGSPGVTDIVLSDGIDEKEILYFAASLENASEHPLAQSIVEKARESNINLSESKGFDSITGKGVKGTIEGKTVLIGNRRLMEEHNIDYKKLEDSLSKLEKEGKTAMMVARDNILMGIIAVADPLKEESEKAISELKKMGIETAMITGDNSRTAKAIGKQVGIDHVISEVLPDGKVEEIMNLQNKFNTVAMVGDGINDAPALKQANVGIAIGTGTDIAIEAADVTLVRGELSGLISAIKLSRGTFTKIKENYFWAWLYNAVAIPVAMFGLLHPMIGAAAMSISSLNVVYNSLRLKKFNFEPDFKLEK